ncbi:MAG: hypothetical protein ABWY20_03240 [Mycobacterium sp.]
MTPREMVDYLEFQIFKAEEHGGDWKFLDGATKERIKKVALYLVLEGWSK